mgnify:CR=1 FL=1
MSFDLKEHEKLINTIEKNHGLVMTACVDDGSAFFIHKVFGGSLMHLSLKKIRNLAAIKPPADELEDDND